MSDDVDDLLDGITDPVGGDASAADAILSPEMRERLRAQAEGRKPPTATRPIEPRAEPRQESRPSESETPKRRPSELGKYRAYRKDELITVIESQEQQLADITARLDALSKPSPVVDPNAPAVRDLAVTIKLAAHLGFGVAASFRGPHWNIGGDEGTRIGDTGAVALAPYAAGMTDWLPWINFAAALSAPVAVRIAEDRRIASLREAPKDNGADQG